MHRPQLKGKRRGWHRLVATLAASGAALLALAACDDNRSQSDPQQRKGAFQDQGKMPERPATEGPIAPPAPRAEAEPPESAPGAAPAAAGVLGTWTVMMSPISPAEGITGDNRVEGTTYRFEEGGKVTVAGAQQCKYEAKTNELRVECDGTVMVGKVEFPDSQTMSWTIEGDKTLTLKKR
jgi:hypothetical protein